MVVLLSIPDEHRFVGAGGFDIQAVSVEVAVVSATALMSRSSLADAAPMSAAPVENSIGSIAPEPATVEALPDRSPEVDAPSLPVAEKLSSQPKTEKGHEPPDEVKPEPKGDRVTLARSVAEGGVASQGTTNRLVTTLAVPQ